LDPINDLTDEGEFDDVEISAWKAPDQRET